MERDLELEEEADEVFNDTLQDVADSLEARDPETVSCGKAETPSKKLKADESEFLTRVLESKAKKSIDDTPHQLFVEMDELQGDAWVEIARWIKYEEDLDAERGDWGRPHIASLYFHSLMQLRKQIEQGSMMLDNRALNLSSLLTDVVDTLVNEGKLKEELKSRVLAVLLYRHLHVQHRTPFGFIFKKNGSREDIQDPPPTVKHDCNESATVLEMSPTVQSEHTLPVSSPLILPEEVWHKARERKESILACMEEGAEGAVLLVGALPWLDLPIVTFVRLAKAINMPNTFEVSLPVRFLFVLLVPKHMDVEGREMGRSMATLMANPEFHDICYQMEKKKQLLRGILDFLDESVILPPGDWARGNLLPISQMMETRRRRKHLKQEPAGGAEGDKACEGEEEMGARNPFERTMTPFGGLVQDVRQRHLRRYWSDFQDGLTAQCLAAIIFIYFACLSGTIAFGGLMGDKTENLIGISETLIVSSISGVIFALLAGCPLIIIGVTGPVLLYDESLYVFCLSYLPGLFLHWRFWIGLWTFAIALLVAGFEGSTLVRFFTRFTKDIFAGLVALLFISEAFNKLGKIFQEHPLLTTAEYCQALNTSCPVADCGTSKQPNIALLSLVLMFSTFIIAYALKIIRNSQFLERRFRRALGDFGVPIAIAAMLLVDWLAGDSITEKLNIPDGIQVTNASARSWLISPTGRSELALPVWAMFAAIIPAILLYLLIFMETQICELIIMERTGEAKGAGLHLDIVLLSFINLFSSIVGGPWVCAATVRAVSHLSALTVMSSANIPGVAPRIVGVRDQRLTAILVYILLGLSVLMAPVLKKVPFAVLFGVFLYMGVCGLQGLQFFDRVLLMLRPEKHHPSVSYVHQVKLGKMVLFTLLQAAGLALLWLVKSFPDIALLFPFFIVLMIPYRYTFKYFFTEVELTALDGPEAGSVVSLDLDESESDFYRAAASCPTCPKLTRKKSC